MLEGAGVVDILPNILALLGFAVIFFLVAIWRFKFNQREQQQPGVLALNFSITITKLGFSGRVPSVRSTFCCMRGYITSVFEYYSQLINIYRCSPPI